MNQTYTVNVHIGGIIQLQVSASDEDDAELLAMAKALQLLQKENVSTFDLDVIDAEIINKVIDIKHLDKIFENLKLKIGKNND